MRIRPPALAGLILVIVGAAFLLRNTGLVELDWSVLGAILLVAIGAAIVLGAFGRGRRGGGSRIWLPRGPAELEVNLSAGAGRFVIGGGADDLFELSSSDEDVRWRADRQGDRGRVRVRQEPAWIARWRPGVEWEASVASDVPAALDLTIGAGRLTLDLHDVRLVGARVSLGAASGSMRLPRPIGDVRIAVSLGAASLEITIPAGVEARVTTRGGLLSLSGPSETSGWATARDRVTVSVSGAAASLRVQQA
ncbi:MAG TPA: hypothetical protein VGK63_06665 [Candidatus Limnocylindrales bacterium]